MAYLTGKIHRGAGRALRFLLLLHAASFPCHAIFDGEFDEEPRCACDQPDTRANQPGSQKPANGRWALEAARIGFLSLAPAASSNLKNPGIGGRYDLSVRIPAVEFMNREHFEIRPGFFVGGLYHALGTTTGSGETGIVPAVGYLAVDFHKVWSRVIPYAAVGAGAAYFFLPANANLGGVIYGSNLVAAALYGAAGLKFYLGGARKWFVRMELNALHTVAESQITMVQGSLGLGYRFGKKVWD